jgi:hypothetical protein
MTMEDALSVAAGLWANPCPACGRRHRKDTDVIVRHAAWVTALGYLGYDYARETWVRADYRVPRPPNYDVPGPVTARLDAQDPDGEGLKPGTPGYWSVWGARAMDIRPGDLVMSGWKDSDDPSVIHHAEYEVAEMAGFKDPMMDTVRVGFIATTGKFASVGMMQPMKLVRRGTHCTLSDYVR